ncbi:MAG: DUF481 domain-containing protein [Burkholderiaceae bacterium]|nr:DUF481 domain-containing protein [Burkholderiaceae bacterium]
MRTRRSALVFIAALLSATGPPGLADEIRLVNGDRLTGTTVRKAGDELVFQTDYAGELKIKWSEVVSLVTSAAVTVLLADDTTVTGLALDAGDGRVRINAGDVLETAPLPLNRVAYINPPPEVTGRGVRLQRSVNIGASANRGNTENNRVHVDAEVVARTRSNRYTAGAILDRAKEGGIETRSSSLAYMKYDHFLDDKWYAYANGTFNKDRFKDLNLRTTLGVGAGYQFWESEQTNLSLEGGLNYVNSDYELSPDESDPAARWSLKFDHFAFGNRLQFFHFHELLVDIRESRRTLLRTQTGLRMPLGAGVAASLQVNADYENVPAPGRAKLDRNYLLNLGYRW